MAGNQSRGLIQSAKTRGWDPTVIEGHGSIANFDVDQGNLPQYPVGRLPGGTPDGWPDDWDNGRRDPGERPTDCTFSYPDVSREWENRGSQRNPTSPSERLESRGSVTPASIPMRVGDTRSIFEAPFSTPDTGRETRELRTKKADPYPGMPGSR